MKLYISSQYGNLSRGRHSARKGQGKQVIWAQKERGMLVITSPGEWHLHATDGFSRTARALLVVKEDGTWSMRGDSDRFRVIEEEE